MDEEDRCEPYHWGELWAEYERDNEKCRLEYDRKTDFRGAKRRDVKAVHKFYELMHACHVGRVA